MSEIAKIYQLTQVLTQPPLRWYFDPKILEIELRILFDDGPGYIGHELLVPNLGDYHVLDWMGNAKMLVRNKNGVELLSNICRHRQATMLEGRGSAKNIVCPLHRWTYRASRKIPAGILIRPRYNIGMAYSSQVNATLLRIWRISLL